jgi:peptidoglycan/xylan/chitin deacetylase (PgdA/CDA1 family)
VNPIVKGALLATAKAFGGFAVSRGALRSRFRILAYHGVDDADQPVVNFDGFQVPTRVFRAQMEWVGRRFTVWPLDRILRSMRDGAALPHRVLAISFDDGYKNNVVRAVPILREYGFHATFFVTTGFVDGTLVPWWYRLRSRLARSAGAKAVADIAAREEELKALPAEEREARVAGAEEPVYPMMNWDDVKKLVELGFDVGPHTVSHVAFARETPARVEEEIRMSTARVREMTGRAPACYSYPYGRFEDIGPEVVGLLRFEGFLGAVTTVTGLNRPGEDPFRLKRLNITGNHRGAAFEALLSGWHR